VISLTCLLGLTWLTGFLLYSETTALAFIFTIANGLQGVFIFVDRCLLNVKIRTALLDGLKRFHCRLVILRSLFEQWENALFFAKINIKGG